MKLTDLLREIGRPIAYHPGLAPKLGGVNAAVLFGQLFYWQARTQNPLGVFKTADELEEETGLSYEEQRTARKALRTRGVLVETNKRLEHKLFFRIDEDALEALLCGDAPKQVKSTSRNGESPFRETGKPKSADEQKPCPPTVENLDRGDGKDQVVIQTKTTAETTSEITAAATHAKPPVDNFAAAAASDSKSENNPERVLTDLLIAMEAERGKSLTIDRTKDRVHVLTWVGKGVNADQLREAHRRAVARRNDDSDERPTYAGFVAPFVAEVMTPTAAPATVTAPVGEWFKSPEGVDAKGKELGRRDRKADEDWRYYRVIVARAAKDTKAIEHVLTDAQRFNSVDLYQFARRTFGDALMPVDDYAS
ncbi:hypothetical protein [Paraburkholderia kirstenboschensis]|uniref:Uncharacterized protein n=1 Tax=Paraburkholderia kirstenboschensis TaxID=1245436 RepID=A0ABZ0ETS0_9BURK|nr:hypothetical protein [Paraburkholderia kirstenboschensis]WOD19817.1 hypothetical protein RW095_26780 [Paraburkholderia kirstenboschensis]